MKEKKADLYAARIRLKSYAADTEDLEEINERYFAGYTSSPIVAFAQFGILAEEQENPFCADGYMNEISDFMCHQLLELHKELFSTLPVATEDSKLSLSIFRAALNGAMNYMKELKQLKTVWCTTPDIVQK